MKKGVLALLVGAVLLVLSGAVYALQVAVLHRPEDTLFYFLQDLAFLPLEAAIVTFALDRLLSSFSRREQMKKINMAVGTFFSEAGTDIMKGLISFAEQDGELFSCLKVGADWTESDYESALERISSHPLKIECRPDKLEEVKAALLKNRDFMMRMLENPNLLEQDTFTNVLLALYHVAEELRAREGLDGLPESDRAHLAGDIQRALRAILVQWLCHMRHLRTEYPYLYSLEVRRNPFGDSMSAVVQE